MGRTTSAQHMTDTFRRERQRCGSYGERQSHDITEIALCPSTAAANDIIEVARVQGSYADPTPPPFHTAKVVRMIS